MVETRRRPATTRDDDTRRANGDGRDPGPIDRLDAPDSANPKAADLARFKENAAGKMLTTNQGVPRQRQPEHAQAGERGPSLLEDFHFREKITHFDHERIPERVVHARGSGAHGFFQVYESLARYTKARLPPGPVRADAGLRALLDGRGLARLDRHARATSAASRSSSTREEGVFDLVGNNMPVFFIQDAIKFPDLIHAVKPEPDNEMPQAASAHDTFWDFISLMPESMHMIMWLMSDRAIPRSFRMMEGFGVHTFRFVDAGGTSRFVKFHWKPLLGVHSVAWDEAQKISGKDPDFLRRDLWEAIEQGNYPEYELGVQVVEEEREHEFDFDLLDPTKLIPEELVPVERVGRLMLNRNPDNFFAETEQVAFHPGHVVPGHRLHQRSAAAGPPLLVHRHAADAPRGAELPRDPDQPPRRAGAQPPARRLHAPDHQPRQGVLRAELDRRRLPDAGALRGGRLRRVPRAARRARSPRALREVLRPLQPGHVFFDSQSPPEQDHIVEALRFELGKVERPAHPRAR